MMDYKDIRRYFEGERSPGDRNKLECAMRFDPYLASFNTVESVDMNLFNDDPSLAIGVENPDSTMMSLYTSIAEAIASGEANDALFFKRSLEGLVWDVENPDD